MFNKLFIKSTIVQLGFVLGLIELSTSIYGVSYIIKYYDNRNNCSNLMEMTIAVCAVNVFTSIIIVVGSILILNIQRTNSTELQPLFVSDDYLMTVNMLENKIKKLMFLQSFYILTLLINVWTIIVYFQISSTCKALWLGFGPEILILLYINFYLNILCIVLLCCIGISHIYFIRNRHDELFN